MKILNGLFSIKNKSFIKYLNAYVRYSKAPDFGKSLIMRKEISLINKIFEQASILNKFKIILLERLVLLDSTLLSMTKIVSISGFILGISLAIVIPSSILMKFGIIVGSVASMFAIMVCMYLLSFFIAGSFLIMKCIYHYYMKHELLRM
jgi:hypothetical protein